MGITFTATSKAADAPDVEPGIYDATLLEISQKFITGGQYGDGDRFEWAFTLLDDDGEVLYEREEPVVVEGLTSMSLNTTSKTRPKAIRYLRALMNDSEFAFFEDGAGFDAGNLEGRQVQVDVAIRDSGWPTVVNVLPARKKRSRKSADSE
jgi:hypothetical protein